MQNLDGLREKWTASINGAASIDALEAIRVEALGKKGEITGLMKTLGALSPDERKQAGQALNEISSVSQDLARLIQAISADTQTQADIATKVAGSMQEILRITGQTTTSTQQTAVSIGELTELAVELKGSVAGFKV